MLNVEHSGYSIERGWFSDEYLIDTDKTDYEIRFPNGDIYRQNSEFHRRTADWNYDGDVYEQFGAFFLIESLGRGEFLTPVDMVNFITEQHCSIPGITAKTVLGKKESLNESLRRMAADKQPGIKDTDQKETRYER